MKVLTPLFFFVMFGIALGGGESLASDATERVDHFLFELQRGKWQLAYNDLSPAFQQQCGGKANSLGEKIIASYKSRATEWKITESKVAGHNATVVALVQRESGKPITTGVSLSLDADRWMIDSVEVAGKELCPSQKTTEE